MGRVSEERRATKETLVGEVRERLKMAPSTILTNYRGLTVEEDTELRRRLRAVGVQHQVIKNTLLRRAATEAGLADLSRLFEGPTAVSFSPDVVVAARELMAFSKDHPMVEVKGGLVEGRVIDRDGAERLASLPPRQVLLAQVAGALCSPLQAAVTVLSAPMRGFAVAVGQLAEARSAGGVEAVATR